MIQARLIFLEKEIKYSSTIAIFVDNRVTKTTHMRKLR
jgi:hypothetical protein